MSQNLNDRLKWLQSNGCYPSIYLRGDMWRAHVNASGNYWSDAKTPWKALEDAIILWMGNGRPMDGMASE